MSVPGAFHPLWYNIRIVTKCGVSTAALFDRNILSAQESVGVSPRDHIEGLDHTREAFMSAALSDGERSTQKTPSLPGVLRGALGWIDLPRRRTFDPKLQVGEQACYGGVTKEKESRGIPRGALDWIDLPRRRTFDPELHVGEQASYGESTNETESRGVPRGSLDWIDLPRRRTFDLKLHVGEQACHGEGTTEIESRGVPRGTLDWIDLPRRRTFDPKLHVGEQACSGEGTNEIEIRSAPRGALDWIDLPRRRTFDPKLHVGEQACVGEGTNEIESRGVPRGALDWIDLPRRRIFDPKLHVGEQAYSEEVTNEMASRESVSENAYAKMPRSIRRRWSLGSVSDTRVDDNPRRKKGFQLELGRGHELADARRGVFVSPRKTKSIPAISLSRQHVNTAPEDDTLPVKGLIIGPHVEKIRQLSETEPSANNCIWRSKVIRNVFNTTAPVPVDIPRRSSVSCRVDSNTESIHKQVHRLGDIDQDRPSCGSDSPNESAHLDSRRVLHDVPQHILFPLSQPPTPLSENKAEGTDIDLGAIPMPRNENCKFETKSELDEPLDRDTNAMGGVHGFRWRRSSTTPVAMDLPRPFAANPTDLRGLWSDNDGDTLVKNGDDHEDAMNTLQPEVWSVNAQKNRVGSSSSDGARNRLVNQLKISGTSRMVGTGVDSGAFVAGDVCMSGKSCVETTSSRTRFDL